MLILPPIYDWQEQKAFWYESGANEMKNKRVFANWWPYVSAFIGIAGIILAIIVIPGNATIAYRWLILIGIVIVIGYIVLLVGIYNLTKIAGGTQNINVAECSIEADETYLSVEPYAGVGFDRYVSIYYRESKTQRLIGIGVVNNIIGDDIKNPDYVSILVLSELKRCKDIWDKLKANEKNILMSIKLTQAISKTEAYVEVNELGKKKERTCREG